MATTSEPQTTPPSRRGRPRAGERAERRQRVLDAALAEVAERGYEKTTMLAIAKRAGASKETLYAWFGNKAGLFNTLIEENGERAAVQVRAALDGGGDPVETLTGFCVGLVNLLTAEQGVALNRAAMTAPELAEMLLASGRHRVGPIVEGYLASLDEDGVIAIEDPGAAFTLLYGLAVRDIQIRVLLGEDPPAPEVIVATAVEAVDAFFTLCAPD